jgi:uncharacterized protein HemY
MPEWRMSLVAKALDALGRLRCRQGRYDQAADRFAEAASRWGDLSADAARDESLEALGDALAAAGCSQEAARGRVSQWCVAEVF